MELVHEFTVPVPPKQAFDVLTDIERVAPCMPGASLDSVDGDEFTGRVKVKVGPMQVTYRGSARFTEIDEDGLKATMEAKGNEMRGSGTAGAVVTAQLTGGDEGTTHVVVTTDLTVTGRPAQFGRGVMEDVGARLIETFARKLEAQILQPEEPEPAPAEAASTGTTAAAAASSAGTERAREPEEPEAIDLLALAGAPVVQRLLPAVGVLAVLLIIVAVVRRRRR